MANPNWEQNFREWMRTSFRNVAERVAVNPTDYGYTLITHGADNTYNCFAYAVGVTTRKILGANNTMLNQQYNALGYFMVEDGVAQVGDVEVYYTPNFGPGTPRHAHKWRTANMCRSKMSDDCVISHTRDFLQCTMPNSPQYRFGTVGRVYRFNQAELDKYNAQFTTTSSGRKVQNSQTGFTSSGKGPVPNDRLHKTRSGRVFKSQKNSAAGKTAAQKQPATGKNNPTTTKSKTPATITSKTTPATTPSKTTPATITSKTTPATTPSKTTPATITSKTTPATTTNKTNPTTTSTTKTNTATATKPKVNTQPTQKVTTIPVVGNNKKK